MAPEATSSHGDEPIYLRLSSYDVPSSVVVSQPANPSGFPPISVTLPAHSTYTIDLTGWKEIIENKPANQVLNKGILIESSQPITAYYEEASFLNSGIFSLLGSNALGRNFLIPGQNTFSNDAEYVMPSAYNSFDIVAIEDNTVVIITPSNDIIGHQKDIPFTIILNKGQTYSAVAAVQNGAGHLLGSKVVSSKQIAVTIKDDSLGVDACADLICDQIIPIDVFGFDFIIVRGYLNAIVNDRAFVIASQDNTSVYINGSSVPATTIQSGETASFILTLADPALFIHADKPVSVMHLTGYTCEVGSSVVPPIGCTGSTEVAFTRTTSFNFGLILFTKDGSQDDFLLDGNPTMITASQFSIVPGTSNPVYVYSRIEFNNTDLPPGNHIIANTTERFHLGMINANSLGNSSCRYGYFSNYNSLYLGPDQAICQGDSLILDAGPGRESYLWNTGADTRKITVLQTGTYSVTVTDHNCSLSDAVDILVFEEPNVSLGPDAQICPPVPVTLTASGGPFINYLWNTGATTASIIITEAGQYSVTITDADGCNGSDTVNISLGQQVVGFSPCFDVITTTGARPTRLAGGFPYGGVYSGSGVSNNLFYPGTAGVGIHAITYTYPHNFGCGSNQALQDISVYAESPFNCGDMLTDIRDGKQYRTFSVGGDCWFSENLNYGSMLPRIQPQTDNCMVEKYCKDDLLGQCTVAGGFYQWDELMYYQDSPVYQDICPPGWHAATFAEWDILIDINLGNGDAGRILKDLTITTGFLGLLNGLYYFNNLWSFSSGITTGSMFWTSTMFSADRATARGINSINPSVSIYHSSHANAFPVRCVKDN